MISPNRITQYDEPQAGGAIPSTRSSSSRMGAVQVIWSRRWWVLLTTVLCVIGSFVYLSKQTPIFASSSRLYIQQSLANAISLSQQNTTTPQSGLATQVELIKSTPLLRNAADKPEIKQLDMMRGIEGRENVLKGGLSVQIGSTNDIVTISFETPYREEAAPVVNAIVDAYVTFMANQRSTTAAEVLRILQKQDKDLAEQLRVQLKKSLDFKKENSMLSFTDERGNIILQRLSKLSEMLTSAQFETMEAKARYEALRSIANEPAKLMEAARAQYAAQMVAKGDSNDLDVSVPLDDDESKVDEKLATALDPLRAQVEQAEMQLKLAHRTRTDDNDEIREASASVALLKQRLVEKEGEVAEQRQAALIRAKERSERRQAAIKQRAVDRDQRLITMYVASLEQHLAQARERENQLQVAFNDQKSLGFDLNTKAAEFATLDADLKRIQRLSDIVANRIKELNVTEDAGLVNISILEVANTPGGPIRPDRNRTMAMGLVLGLLMGVGVALGLDLLDQRIRSVDEVTATLNVPVLGMVPSISAKETAPSRGRKVHLDPTSDVAEAYRTIRTAVFFSARRGKMKKLLITSPAPGDGKTTSASNLAIAMAQAGGRILLMDCDLRRATQHKIFELVDPAGLCDVISGESTLEEAIHPTGIEHLDILPRGSTPHNPAEILNGKKFADLLEQLSAKYDHIVIDSPPVTPVTDAMILGSMCDQAILVLRAEKSTRRLSEHALEALSSVGTPVLGALINDVPRGRDRYGYYYGYGYGYKYYEYESRDESDGASGKRARNAAGQASGKGPASSLDDDSAITSSNSHSTDNLG